MNAPAQAKKDLALAAEDAGKIKKSLLAFSESARVLSSNHPRMIEEYPDQWVAISGGAVLAHGKSIESVLKSVDKLDVDCSNVIIRLIEKNTRTFIL